MSDYFRALLQPENHECLKCLDFKTISTTQIQNFWYCVYF